MNARDLIAEASKLLRDAGVASPEYDAAELLAFVCGVGRLALTTVDVSAEQQAQYDVLVARRAQREPLQHLTGTAPFRYRELAVGPGVFVPRPETEVLVGWILDRIADVKNPLVVDLCSGSGAIAERSGDRAPRQHGPRRRAVSRGVRVGPAKPRGHRSHPA